MEQETEHTRSGDALSSVPFRHTRLHVRDKIDDKSSLFGPIRLGIRFCVGAQHEQIKRIENPSVPKVIDLHCHASLALPSVPSLADGMSGYTQ